MKKKHVEESCQFLGEFSDTNATLAPPAPNGAPPFTNEINEIAMQIAREFSFSLPKAANLVQRVLDLKASRDQQEK